MTPKFSLPGVFRDLANDQLWDEWGYTTARLALMVVEKEMQTITEWTKEGPRPALTQTLQDLHVNPPYYAKVKKRVEEADTEEK